TELLSSEGTGTTGTGTGTGTGTSSSKLSQLVQFSGRELTSVIDAKTFVPRGASLTGLFTTIEQSRSGVNWTPQNANVHTKQLEDPTRPHPSEQQKKSTREAQSSEHRKSTTGAPRVHRPMERKRMLTGVLVAVAAGLGIAAAVGLTRPDLAQTIEEEPT